MAGTFIATTRRGTMRPLASQGIFATDCFHQVQSLLRHLSPAHALLLAEPVHDAARESVDWYAAVDGTPVPFKDLPPEQAHALTRRILDLAGDISRAADELENNADAHKALSGHLLRLALSHPAQDDLWLVGEQPVLINWGFAPGGVGALPEDLTRLAPPPPPVRPAPAAPVPVAAPVAAGAGCLSWLLLLLLALLLGALGIVPLPGGCTLFKPDAAALDAAKAKEGTLRDDIEKLRAELLKKAELCRPPKKDVIPPRQEAIPPKAEEPKAEPKTEPPLLAENKEPEMTEPFLGETPLDPEPTPEPPKKKDVVPPKVESPKETPKPEPPKKETPKPKKDDPLRIPEDARKNKDMGFLEGCWRSETGLYSSRTGEPIIAEYCFDKNGRGRRLVRERGGEVCNGPVTADFDGSGQLRMDSAEARCPRGSKYVPQRVECTGNDNSTYCKGRELAGKRNAWDAKFRRK